MKTTRTHTRPLRNVSISTLAIWLAAGTIWATLFVLLRSAS
jgi:hypothetical protein